jgi:transcriptional regulator with XRE-family HTH domain
MGRQPKTDLPADLRELLREVGANIAIFREEAGISQSELSRRSKISLTTINEIETRRFRDIRLSTLCSIAKALQVPVLKLLENTSIDVDSRDQAQLLKASEALWKITRKLRKT